MFFHLISFDSHFFVLYVKMKGNSLVKYSTFCLYRKFIFSLRIRRHVNEEVRIELLYTLTVIHPTENMLSEMNNIALYDDIVFQIVVSNDLEHVDTY
jgi:hypothetical protein